MASSDTTMSASVVVRHVRTKYHWPALQLNFWLLIMIIGSSTILGIFSYFVTVQQQLQVGTPWLVSSSSPAFLSLLILTRYFPYWITVGALAILFILGMLYLISQRQLLPGIVVMGSFILFVLWMVGLIVVSIELWGPTGSVNGNCNLYVTGSESSGPFIQTLAYLEQHSICEYFLCLACCAKCG
jgi:hypothetical protein